jgi:sugar lactone lactonase YvrE
MSNFLTTPSFSSFAATCAARIRAGAAVLLCLVAAGCGGDADAPPPPEGTPPAAVAPVITQQPAPLSVIAGQPASFTVAATGTAPLAYQWRRNGAAIAGATSTSYMLAAVATADDGAVFSAVVTNVAGSATSDDALLGVAAAAPVLTITQQPVDTSVTAGTTATFTVAATCSSGTLDIQWQRNSGASGAFVALSGATATSISVSPGISDSGALFRAALDCSGQSATTSGSATLTVTAPGGVMLDLLPTVGLRDQALFSGGARAIDRNADDSYTIVAGNQFKKMSADLLSITPLLGQIAGGSADGSSATATFNAPLGLTHDAAGNVYVADTGNSVIRRIAADGSVSTLAGLAGATGTTDGTGSAARFNMPNSIALGPDGDLYVADTENGLIRRVTTAGVVTTYAGSTNGYADNPTPLAAQFFFPRGIAAAPNGDLLVADTGNSRVRRILRSGTAAGAVQTLAGSGSTNVDASPRDGTGTAAVIVGPGTLLVAGNTLTLRDGAGLLRQIDLTSAVVTTFAGSRLHPGTIVDGPAALSSFNTSGGGLTTAPSGGFMLAEGQSISHVDASGFTQTLANNQSGSATDAGTGVLKQLPLNSPGASVSSASASLTVDPAGNVLVATAYPKLVRRISPTGDVTLVAGFDTTQSQLIDGIGSAAQFTGLGSGLGHDAAGALYVSDFCAVRKIDLQGAVTLLTGQRSSASNGFSQCGGIDGSPAVAQFGPLLGLTVGTDGNVYVADQDHYAIRRIDATGNVTTIAGALGQQNIGSPDGAATTTARFRSPLGIAAAPDGSLVVLDASRIRRVSADRSTVSTVDTSSVSGQIGFTPIAVGADGILYFGAADGLWAMREGQAATRLIAGGPSDAVVLGASPHLTDIVAITVLGPKQLLLVSGGKVLKATLP